MSLQKTRSYRDEISHGKKYISAEILNQGRNWQWKMGVAIWVITEDLATEIWYPSSPGDIIGDGQHNLAGTKTGLVSNGIENPSPSMTDSATESYFRCHLQHFL